jgi:hypothetical protein
MEKKSTLNNKLKSYSALAGTLIAGGTAADAQIVYTDVTPDASVTTGSMYNLDLDNNSVVDFQIALAHQTYMYGGTFAIQYDYALIAPADPANAIDTMAGPVAHNAGETINSSMLWVDGSASSYQLLGLAFAPPFNPYNTGNFLGQTDKYVGLRFRIGGADHYGWVRLDLNAAATEVIVKDYAYDATAGNSIVTGAMTTGIKNELSGDVQIFSANNLIHVNMNKATVDGVITITDVAGKLVSTTAVTSASNVISMESANAGIYFVTVAQGDARKTEKVIIK